MTSEPIPAPDFHRSLPEPHVYIAAALPLLEAARACAAALRAEGIPVLSTWHESNATVAAEDAMSARDKRACAQQCLREVRACSLLVLLYGAETSRHGSVFETGMAVGLGKPIMAIRTCDVSLARLPTILIGAAPRCSIPDHESLPNIAPPRLARWVREEWREALEDLPLPWAIFTCCNWFFCGTSATPRRVTSRGCTSFSRAHRSGGRTARPARMRRSARCARR